MQNSPVFSFPMPYHACAVGLFAWAQAGGAIATISSRCLCACGAGGGMAAEELRLVTLFLPRRLLFRFSLWVPQPCCGTATAFLCGFCPLPVRLCPTPSRELAPCTRSLGGSVRLCAYWVGTTIIALLRGCSGRFWGTRRPRYPWTAGSCLIVSLACC